jgi:4-hydroxy-2-oxoglutarate aldolase
MAFPYRGGSGNVSQPTISLRGVFPPIPTPFDADGRVAYQPLAENLARWNQFDLAGYVVLGSNGEAAYLDEEEKVRVWQAARPLIPAGKLMIAGTGCESTRATVALTRHAAEAGADAALVLTPHYYGAKMTPDALVRHYEALADASPIPVLIYTVPKFTHVDLDAAAIARTARHPNVVGVKDTSGNMAKMAETVRLAGPDFQVLAGSAGFLLAGLALANVAPQRCIDLYRLFRAGELDQAADLQQRMVPVNAAVTARFGIAGLKAALDMLGYYGGPVRSPLLGLTEGERQILRDVLTEGELL